MYTLLTRTPVVINILLYHATPRLACMKPAASVNSELESNSSLYNSRLCKLTDYSKDLKTLKIKFSDQYTY